MLCGNEKLKFYSIYKNFAEIRIIFQIQKGPKQVIDTSIYLLSKILIAVTYLTLILASSYKVAYKYNFAGYVSVFFCCQNCQVM